MQVHVWFPRAQPFSLRMLIMPASLLYMYDTCHAGAHTQATVRPERSSGPVMHQSIARAAAAHGREQRAVASSTWPLITPNASLHATEQADSLARTTM